MFRADTWGRGFCGGSVGQNPLPPFLGTPKLYKEGMNVADCILVLNRFPDPPPSPKSCIRRGPPPLHFWRTPKLHKEGKKRCMCGNENAAFTRTTPPPPPFRNPVSAPGGHFCHIKKHCIKDVEKEGSGQMVIIK